MNIPQPTTDIISAISSASGTAAIAIVRLSGKGAAEKLDKIFRGKKKVINAKHKEIIFGKIMDDKQVLDEVVLNVYHAPNSYTGEDLIEIFCHGSLFIQQRILQLLFSEGIRLAEAGEFTMRAFLNGKMDLSQAEAVADIIHADTKKSHHLAMQQMRGGYSEIIKKLREELIQFRAMLELELDFAEEDVEFADRNNLRILLEKIKKIIADLIASFALGNVLKNGVAVVIAGKPNVGKSSLLNTLLKEDKAIVSSIPGTTRDVIEDSIVLDGIRFRFSDTAGIRKSSDEIERMGIHRSKETMSKAQIIILMFDEFDSQEIKTILEKTKKSYTDAYIIPVLNKIDLFDAEPDISELPSLVLLSVKNKIGIAEIMEQIVHYVKEKDIQSDCIVSNERHLQSLESAMHHLNEIEQAMQNNVPSDLYSIDLKHALHYLGSITGEVSVDNVLEHVFSHFCIGK